MHMCIKFEVSNTNITGVICINVRKRGLPNEESLECCQMANFTFIVHRCMYVKSKILCTKISG